MRFVSTLDGDLIPVARIERIYRAERTGTRGAEPAWVCQTGDGQSHYLPPETVELLSSALVTAAPGWFVPEELVDGAAGTPSGVSRVPIVAWMVCSDGRRVAPITVDPDLGAARLPVGSPDGRIFLPDGSEFDDVEHYCEHLRRTRPPPG